MKEIHGKEILGTDSIHMEYTKNKNIITSVVISCTNIRSEKDRSISKVKKGFDNDSRQSGETS